jgi:hypothetical protein
VLQVACIILLIEGVPTSGSDLGSSIGFVALERAFCLQAIDIVFQLPCLHHPRFFPALVPVSNEFLHGNGLAT